MWSDFNTQFCFFPLFPCSSHFLSFSSSLPVAAHHHKRCDMLLNDKEEVKREQQRKNPNTQRKSFRSSQIIYLLESSERKRRTSERRKKKRQPIAADTWNIARRRCYLLKLCVLRMIPRCIYRIIVCIADVANSTDSISSLVPSIDWYWAVLSPTNNNVILLYFSWNDQDHQNSPRFFSWKSTLIYSKISNVYVSGVRCSHWFSFLQSWQHRDKLITICGVGCR